MKHTPAMTKAATKFGEYANKILGRINPILVSRAKFTARLTSGQREPIGYWTKNHRVGDWRYTAEKPCRYTLGHHLADHPATLEAALCRAVYDSIRAEEYSAGRDMANEGKSSVADLYRRNWSHA